MVSEKPKIDNQPARIKGAYDHLKKDVANKRNTSTSSVRIGRYFLIFTMIFVLLTGLGVFSPDIGIFPGSNHQSTESYGTNDGPMISAILYSSPTCGCCHNYVGILNDNGFDVFQKRTNDYMDIKTEKSIPVEHQSCHTMIIGDYFVEGHIPISSIMKMLQEKPDIDGIALAGMPSGSPGMGGAKSETWDIYAISGGSALSIYDSV